jgi:predicted DNA-binding protein (UPF0251 family)
LTDKDFEILANQIGPREGAVREALRSYWVNGCTQSAAATGAGISRATMSQYVNAWKAGLEKLATVDWQQIERELQGKT